MLTGVVRTPFLSLWGNRAVCAALQPRSFGSHGSAFPVFPSIANDRGAKRFESRNIDARLRENQIEKECGHGCSKSDVRYNESANDLLNNLFEFFEQARIPGVKNVEYQDGVLSIEFEGHDSLKTQLSKTILINKHYVNRQLWYSSPVSGGDYFSFGTGWRSVRSNVNILQKLKEDIGKLTAAKVELPDLLARRSDHVE